MVANYAHCKNKSAQFNKAIARTQMYLFATIKHTYSIHIKLLL